MNFFGKRKRGVYFKGKPEQTFTSDLHGEMSDLQRKYVHFCQSPLVQQQDSAEQFLQLCAHECVGKVAMTASDNGWCLLVVVPGVTLRNPRTRLLHHIGDMVIVMRRKPSSEVYFFNQTKAVSKMTPSEKVVFHHPHVGGDGLICSSYANLIRQDLASGQVLSAVEMSIDALYTFGPDFPRCDILDWPVFSENKGEK